jgi:hypothetical protein
MRSATGACSPGRRTAARCGPSCCAASRGSRGTAQLINPGTGLAWSLNYASNPSVAVLTLARTSDNAQRWQQSSTRLIIPASSLAGPLLDFTDVSHGWLVLGNATWHTTDGGRTWTRG